MLAALSRRAAEKGRGGREGVGSPSSQEGVGQGHRQTGRVGVESSLGRGQLSVAG